MTVSTTNYYTVAVGNGATTIFSFNFIADNSSTIQVTYTDTNGVETVLSSTQYTLAINAPAVGQLWGIGGTVTYPLTGSPIPVGSFLTILRDVPYEQTVSIANQGAFYPQAVEQGLDLLELQIQQIEGNASTVRNVRAPIVDGEIDMVLPAKASREQSFLYFDLDGLPTAVAGIPSTTPIGPASRLFFLSNYASLALANSAAAGADGVLVIDESVTLLANTTLTAKVILFAGGVITRGSFNLIITGTVQAGDVAIFDKAGTGTTSIGSGIVNVKWWAPTYNPTDDSKCFQQAFDCGLPTRIPKGTYFANATINYKILIKGDDSSSTIIQPFNTAVATFTYKPSTAWSYSPVIENIKFDGPNSGVGFTFGQTVPANFVNGDQNANNVTFRNCYFSGLTKGVQCPFGNIGVQFEDCGWNGNYYGCYFLNNKFGGAMHAGNKYFLNCEFDINTCAVYINNTQDGYGAFEFDGTIFEGNDVAVYAFSNVAPPISAFSFKNYWSESNGILSPGSPATATLDVWTGTVQTTASFTTHAWIFDGDSINAQFEKGFFSDCWLKATNSVVISEKDRFESDGGYGGGPLVVSDAATSRIIVRDSVCDSGGVQTIGAIADGIVTQARSEIISSGSGANGRMSIIKPRRVISDLNSITGFNQTFVAECDLTGNVSITGSVVSDGTLYATCNSYTGTIPSGQNSGAVTDTSFALSAGWFAWSVDLRMVSGGNLIARLWNRSTAQFGIVNLGTDNQWHTYGGVGSIASGTPTLFLDFSDTGGGAATWKVSAFQIKKFNTRAEAQDFLASQVYAT